ncbi:purple acid phosphatase family protein [Prevotella communis]|uniref:purple acid phosphatase family protein n=1 Tax=Prevotella communis TaxID=2913614 RepID=UPI001ED9F885|nr:metallophosphoesterase family protein [Prevotella communis]UKK56476.1 metallophosphoesterase family protein [Prevotella communis]UKK62003.1 metallophosphoesterase family protein [Prevotella communis]UKK64830.1 metallophosphoesterase family protein [Prevotella communis]
MAKKRAKRTTLVVILLVLIGAGFWTSSRWDAWFRNPEEAPYVSEAEPHRVLLTFGDSLESSRNVSWQADSILHPSYLELAQLPDGDTVRIEAYGEVFRSRSGVAAYYVARLRQLRPDAQYAYRAVTDGKASQWYHFQTYKENRNNLSFMYVGDVQDTVGGASNRILKEALAYHPQTEFLVCGGDLTDRPKDECWAETFRDVDSICQAMPLLTVTGNHDYLKGVIVSLERRFPLIYSYFLDSKIEDNQVYTVRYGSAQFFLLDSNRELPYLLTQRSWLERELQNSSARWKIVVLHHPLFSLKGHNNLIQRWVFNDLIEEYGVDLVMQGHEHAYGRMTRHDDNDKATTPVYTVSHCSPKNYRIQFDDEFDKFGISSRYYQTVDIKGDTLVMATYESYHHSLYDSLRIVKKGDSVNILDFGRDIPEYMEYTPDPSSKKDRAYAERIEAYKAKHPERMRK